MAVCYAQQKPIFCSRWTLTKSWSLPFCQGTNPELRTEIITCCHFLQGNKSTSKTAFWCRSPIIIWNSAKILKYTAFILLDYDWFDLTPCSFWLVNYTPIISFLPTFVHVPANKRCFLTENYTLQIQWKYQVLFVYHVTEPLRILESHVPESLSFRVPKSHVSESHVPKFHVPESHVSVPLLVNHKMAVSIQIFHGLLLVGKPEFWGWSLAEKASLTCFTAAASLYKSNSSAFFQLNVSLLHWFLRILYSFSLPQPPYSKYS